MIRVYLRLWLATVGLSLGALLVHELLLYNESFTEEASDYYAQYAGAGLEASLAEAARTPDDDALMATLREWWQAPVTRVPVPFDPGEAYRLAPSLDAWWWSTDEGADVLWLRAGKDRWFQIGPFRPYPAPALAERLLLGLAVMASLGIATGILLRPLDQAQHAIVRTAQALASGDLGARVTPTDFRAVPGTGEALNRMADRVEQLVEARQHLLRAASHELRTPIARLRIGLHLLAAADDDREDRASALDADLEELDGLVEELLDHARLQDRTVALEPVEIDVAHEVHAVWSRTVDHALPSLEVQADEIIAWADPRLFRRAIRNVLANAQRYAESRVCVHAKSGPAGVQIRVEDDGPGIPEDQREQALAPFGTLDDHSGHGLGLAIVHEIVERHGGQLALADAPGGGLCVRTHWPSR